jgi:TonB family protein
LRKLRFLPFALLGLLALTGCGARTNHFVFSPGYGGISYPSCLYCPYPQYSEEARQAKYQGEVVVQALITSDGHATDVRALERAGLGLEEKAVEAVEHWRFQPARSSNGKFVPVVVAIGVTFSLVQSEALEAPRPLAATVHLPSDAVR